MATDARSVWVKVWSRRPFSGAPSVTPSQLFRDPAELHAVRIPTRKSEELKPMILAYLFSFDNDITDGARRFSKGHRIQSTRWSLQTSNNHSLSSKPQLQSANCFKHSRYVLASVNPSALAIIKFAQPLAMAYATSNARLALGWWC